jgi:predicted transcriptional regulator
MGATTTGSGQVGPRRPRGALERDILACIAAATGPMTPGEVLAAVGGNLAYTTVMTTLSRLHEKGVLRREAAGRAYAYSLTADPDGVRNIAVAQRMRRLLDTGHDRAGVLAHFVADLAPEDEQLLLGLLADPKPEPAGSADDSPTDEP